MRVAKRSEVNSETSHSAGNKLRNPGIWLPFVRNEKNGWVALLKELGKERGDGQLRLIFFNDLVCCVGPHIELDFNTRSIQTVTHNI